MGEVLLAAAWWIAWAILRALSFIGPVSLILLNERRELDNNAGSQRLASLWRYVPTGRRGCL